MRVNSQVRLSKRRQGALLRRAADVARWKSELAAAPEETKGDLESKLAAAEADIAALARKGIK